MRVLLSQIRIRRRLVVAFIALALTTIGAGVTGVLATAYMNRTYTRVLNHSVEHVTTALSLQVATTRRATALRGYLLTGQRDFLVEFLEAQTLIDAQIADFRREPEPYVQDLTRVLAQRDRAYLAAANRARRAFEGGDTESAAQIDDDDVRPANDALRSRIDPFVSSERARVRRERQDAANVAGLVRYGAVGAAALTLTLASMLAWLLARSIVRPLRRLEAAADRMAAGDLRARADIAGADEIAAVGRAFDQMAGAMNSAVAEAHEREERHRAIVETSVEAIITIDSRGVVEGFNPGAERTFGWRADEVVGRNVSMLMPEPDSSSHDDYLREYAGGRPPRIIGIGREVIALRKGGETFPMALSVAEMWLAGRQMFTGIARDLTDLKRAEEGLRRAEAQSAVAREQEALRRVATSVASNAGAREIFVLLAREIAGLLDADIGIVSRFTDDAAHVVGTSGADAGALDGAHLPLHGSSALAEVARTGRSSRVDYAALPDDPIGRRALRLGFSTGVAAPVMVGGALWGALLVATTGDRTVNESAERRLAHFADLLSLAISNADVRERLVEQALTDPLTGLANRRGFYARLNEEISRARRQGTPLGLVMIDVDHFKRVNDTHGHQAGDEVLVAIAHEISTHARRHEIVARIGGEEFAWILPGTDVYASWHAAERARRTVAALAIPEVGHVTVSAGVSDLGPRASAEDLFREADSALYRAKELGRNRSERALPQGPAPERPAG